MKINILFSLLVSSSVVVNSFISQFKFLNNKGFVRFAEKRTHGLSHHYLRQLRKKTEESVNATKTLNDNTKFRMNSRMNNKMTSKKLNNNVNDDKKVYNLSQRYVEELYNKIVNRSNNTSYLENMRNNEIKKYYEGLLKKLNTNNNELKDLAILGNDNIEDLIDSIADADESEDEDQPIIILGNPNDILSALGLQLDDETLKHMNNGLGLNDNGLNNGLNNDNGLNDNADNSDYRYNERGRRNAKSKSENFEVNKKSDVNFNDVGGYKNVKDELKQCIELLKNYKKYQNYNVRIPKGLILEGPPGTGKTLLSKSLAGEADCAFIAVSGADFQEKYIGIGPSRVKELFKLAKENEPCIIFIDEIDAIGRKRSNDGEASSSERDSTLNALLVELDGFKNNSGVFVVSATNRIDLLDSALVRPGRMDKKIYIGLPDTKTREAIVNIHIKGKPYDNTVKLDKLIEDTEGKSGAEIENLLNEAMLNALRYNKTAFTFDDLELVINKMMVGWQPNEHQFTSNIIDHIAIHEMGHAIVGILSKHHSKMKKVTINLSSPNSPGYTIFENSINNIYEREGLLEHLMILLSGRIAEEVFYNISVTTGAINDFEEALKLAERMVVYYGMGSNVIYPRNSEKYKTMIDNDVIQLINKAYQYAFILLSSCKELIYETAEMLKRDKIITGEQLEQIINEKYKFLVHLPF
jgi:cell division protease FtsH